MITDIEVLESIPWNSPAFKIAQKLLEEKNEVEIKAFVAEYMRHRDYKDLYTEKHS